ncbi:hypothetical protein ACFWY6_16995 [Streptomyces sp. NPDC059037]|uniref:hypothetical protein n=1 Tax=Streptomyces sp. NPDC059037 TaxID=3346710 RepID=UPI0036CB9895
MKGITLSAVGNAVPELLHRVVYISAACPTGFTTPDEELHPAEHDGNLLDAAVAKIAVGDIAAQGFARATTCSVRTASYARTAGGAYRTPICGSPRTAASPCTYRTA